MPSWYTTAMFTRSFRNEQGREIAAVRNVGRGKWYAIIHFNDSSIILPSLKEAKTWVENNY